MARQGIIQVGCRVEGPHGDLTTNPNEKGRRIRSRVCGSVVRPCGAQNWVVLFDFNGKEKECSSKSLKLVPGLTGVPREQLAKKASSK